MSSQKQLCNMRECILTLRYNLDHQQYCEGNEQISWSYGTTYFANEYMNNLESFVSKVIKHSFSKKKSKKIINSLDKYKIVFGTLFNNCSIESVGLLYEDFDSLNILVSNSNLEKYPTNDIVSMLQEFLRDATTVYNSIVGELNNNK